MWAGSGEHEMYTKSGCILIYKITFFVDAAKCQNCFMMMILSFQIRFQEAIAEN
jgi:hypothetical protein